MRAHLAGLAIALIIGSEVAAGMAALEGIIFWHNLPLLREILWTAVVVGVVAGAMAWRRTVRWERELALPKM